jgi:hypothetical protein
MGRPSAFHWPAVPRDGGTLVWQHDCSIFQSRQQGATDGAVGMFVIYSGILGAHIADFRVALLPRKDRMGIDAVPFPAGSSANRIVIRAALASPHGTGEPCCMPLRRSCALRSRFEADRDSLAQRFVRAPIEAVSLREPETAAE